jgi:Flp pilus assembly protein TadD
MAKRNMGRLAILLTALFALQSCMATSPALRQARELFNAGDYDRAQEILQRVSETRPGNSEICFSARS